MRRLSRYERSGDVCEFSRGVKVHVRCESSCEVLKWGESQLRCVRSVGIGEVWNFTFYYFSSSDQLQAGAAQFDTNAHRLKRKMWWQNCKVCTSVDHSELYLNRNANLEDILMPLLLSNSY